MHTRPVPIRWLVAAVLVLAGGVEIGWRLSHGVPSPAVGLGFAFASLSVGRAALGWSRAVKRPNIGVSEAFVAGAVVLSLVYALFAFAGYPRAFAPVAWLGSLACLPLALRRRPFGGTVTPSGLSIAVVVFLFAIRNEYLVDRLDLTARHPEGFAWIDTPLWYSIAYGVERGVPAPDLLFSGGVLNYHFGSGLVVNAIRSMTMLPMQTSYFVAIVSFTLALSGMLFASAQAFLRAPRIVCFAAALFGPVMFGDIGLNFSSVLASPVFLFLLLQLLSAQAWRQIPIAILGMVFLVVTKEVHYVFFLASGGLIAAFLFWKVRRVWPSIALAVGFVASRPLYGLLVRIDQKSFLRPFSERFTGEFLRHSLERESRWIALGIFAVAVAYTLRRRAVRFAVVLSTSVVLYLVSLLLTWFVKPMFEPPMDEFSYGWILNDMGQFERESRLLVLMAMAIAGLTFLFRVGPLGRASLRPVSVTLMACLVGYNLWNYWSYAPASPLGTFDRPRNLDPVVPLLAKIPTAGTVIAADTFNWNHENPQWAAFFGHQFYFLRKGRWATAYKNYAQRVESQRVLFTTDDPDVARDIVRRDGITHIIESRERPIPWLSRRPPLASNLSYSVYETIAF